MFMFIAAVKSELEHRVLLTTPSCIPFPPYPSFPTHRGRGVVVGFLKVGYKKLFLLVSTFFVLNSLLALQLGNYFTCFPDVMSI